jgi:WXG100 family type VII secretion target
VSGFAVNLAALAEVLDRMARFERDVQQQLAEVQARVERLHAAWSGGAAEQHRQVNERWTAGAAQMHRAVGALRRTAATAHGNYSAAVSANRGMWS